MILAVLFCFALFRTSYLLSDASDPPLYFSGDGRVGRDVCIRGGLASFSGQPCVVLGTFKGVCACCP
jgi:acetyl-CoA carboxylase alpha subunit